MMVSCDIYKLLESFCIVNDLIQYFYGMEGVRIWCSVWGSVSFSFATVGYYCTLLYIVAQQKISSGTFPNILRRSRGSYKFRAPVAPLQCCCSRRARAPESCAKHTLKQITSLGAEARDQGWAAFQFVRSWLTCDVNSLTWRFTR